VRTPTSAPLERTRKGVGETGARDVGSAVVTVPRASLLAPALTDADLDARLATRGTSLMMPLPTRLASMSVAALTTALLNRATPASEPLTAALVLCFDRTCVTVPARAGDGAGG
jgi:hypothetical protein